MSRRYRFTNEAGKHFTLTAKDRRKAYRLAIKHLGLKVKLVREKEVEENPYQLKFTYGET